MARAANGSTEDIQWQNSGQSVEPLQKQNPP